MKNCLLLICFAFFCAGVLCPGCNQKKASELVFVSNEDDGTVSVIDARKENVIATIAVGKRPRGIRVSANGEKIYVAVSGSPKCPPSMSDAACAAWPADKSKDGVAEIDIATLKVIRVLRAGSDPEQLDCTPDGKSIYVANEDCSQASLVDIATGKPIRSFAVGHEPEGVRVSPDGKLVYITSEANNNITAINTRTGEMVATVATGNRPRDIYFDRASALAYVTSEAGGSVAVIDVKNNICSQTIDIGHGSKPMAVLLSPDGKKLFVSNGRAKTIAVIDARTRRVQGFVEAGARPWGMAITGDGGFLYTANGSSNDVSVIDVATMQVVRKIAVGKMPWGLAIVRGVFRKVE
jgi:YVTN family beta-propeller protein